MYTSTEYLYSLLAKELTILFWGIVVENICILENRLLMQKPEGFSPVCLILIKTLETSEEASASTIELFAVRLTWQKNILEKQETESVCKRP